MTEDLNKKPRRRGRRGGKGRNKKPRVVNASDATAEVIAPSGITVSAESIAYDEVIATAEIKAERERQEQVLRTADGILEGLLPGFIRKRDLQVLDWLCDTLGKTRAQVVKDMLTSNLVRERVSYREANGGGGATSTKPPSKE